MELLSFTKYRDKIVVKLDPGVYVFNSFSGTGKTVLASLLDKYRGYGERVASYTYRDYVKGLPISSILDPYKYDVNAKTKTLPTGQNFIEVTNEGTAPTFLDVRAEMLSDNGFIGVVIDDRYFQQGNPYENDLASGTRSETLLNANHWQGGTTTISGVAPRVNSNAYLGKAYQNFYALNQQPYIMSISSRPYPTRPNNQGVIQLPNMKVLTIQNNFTDNVTSGQTKKEPG